MVGISFRGGPSKYHSETRFAQFPLELSFIFIVSVSLIIVMSCRVLFSSFSVIFYGLNLDDI